MSGRHVLFIKFFVVPRNLFSTLDIARICLVTVSVSFPFSFAKGGRPCPSDTVNKEIPSYQFKKVDDFISLLTK